MTGVIRSVVQPEPERSPPRSPDRCQEVGTRCAQRPERSLPGSRGPRCTAASLGPSLVPRGSNPKARAHRCPTAFHSRTGSPFAQSDSLLFLCLLFPCDQQRADFVSPCPQPQLNVSAVCQEETFSLGAAGRNVPENADNYTFPKASTGPFLDAAPIISLVVNFYPVKQRVFPARLGSFLAPANGA